MKDTINIIKRIDREVLKLQGQKGLLQEQYDILWSKDEKLKNKIKTKEKEKSKIYYSVEHERYIVNSFRYHQNKLKEARKECLVIAGSTSIFTALCSTLLIYINNLSLVPWSVLGWASVCGAMYLISIRDTRKELKQLKKYDIEDFRKKVAEVDTIVTNTKTLIQELVNEKDASFEQLLEIKKEIDKFDEQIEKLKSIKSDICVDLVEEMYNQPEIESSKEEKGRTYKLKNNFKRH